MDEIPKTDMLFLWPGQWMKESRKPVSLLVYLEWFSVAAATIAENSNKAGYHNLITGEISHVKQWGKS